MACQYIQLTSLSTAWGCLILISLTILKMSTAPSAFKHSRILATAQKVAERPVEPLWVGRGTRRRWSRGWGSMGGAEG